LNQSQLQIRGHSIEARIYSETPYNNFLPNNGKLKYFREPDQHKYRIESGVRQGDEISIFYDPMIAKLVVTGKDRSDALQKLRLALKDYRVYGLPTNLRFLKELSREQDYIDWNYDTNFIDLHKQTLLSKEKSVSSINALKAVLAYIYKSQGAVES